MATTEIYIKGLKELQSNFRKSPQIIYTELTKGINKAALITTTRIQQDTPIKTGALKGSIRPAFYPLKAVISPHKDYAVYVHEKTRPHEIRPRIKKALYWKGALHPVKRVMHPGTRGVPFMETGLKKSVGEITTILNNSVKTILDKLSKI